MTSKLINITENWVYQSNKLTEGSYSLTTMEYRMLLALASMVKKEDTNFKEYSFRVKDLVSLFGLKDDSKRYREIKRLASELMKKVVTIYPNKSNKEHFKMYHILQTCEYKNGVLTLKINEDQRKFYLQLEKQYTRYKLKTALQFKSSYSFRIYPLLHQYLSAGTRIIELDDLKTMLKLDNATYDYINRNVIIKSQKEINAKTDIKFTYEDIKEGRKVVALKFYILPNEVQALEIIPKAEKQNKYKTAKPEYANFEQREYTDEDFENFFTNGTKAIDK